MLPHDPYALPPPEEAGRRNFLKFLTAGLGAAFGATLGVPALAFLIDPRNRPAPPGEFKVVAKLSDLKEGEPFAATVREIRHDAWVLHPNDIVGRVWLIRHGDNITCFTVTCPHLGCSVDRQGDKFVCPCHNGTFTLDGVRADPGAGRTNPAPRDMDTLEHKIESDPDDPKDKLILVKFQRFTQNVPQKVLRT
jgi:menaquinol-cytochrome c reductase iron-sulfur subunit